MGWKWLGIGLAGKVSDSACVCANGYGLCQMSRSKFYDNKFRF